MDISGLTRKDIGVLGERVAAHYLIRSGFRVTARNVSRKTGELDIVAIKGKTLHVIEVKSLTCESFPNEPVKYKEVVYTPSDNLHRNKIRKVLRTAQWYASEVSWEGEMQIDGVLVWIRRRDGKALVRYVPQIL